MSFPNSLIDLANRISDKQNVISSSLADNSSRSSSQSVSYVNSQGAGASSSSSAKSPAGNSSNNQQTIFVAGATSSSASASASSSTDDADTSVQVTVPAQTSPQTPPVTDRIIEDRIQPAFQIGSEQNDLLKTTNGQNIITGYAGSDIFDLVSDHDIITDIAKADIITDFDINEDYLLISDSLTVDDLDFRPIDFNGDTVVDSTVIRLRQDGNILAVVLNTILPVVNDQEQRTELDADSSDTLNAVVEYPIDYLLGTSANDTLVSDSERDILIGYGNADIFVLEPSQGNQLADADIIIDFDPGEGDVIQLSSEISFDNDIILETIDLDGNGIVESTSIYLTNGTVLAIAQGAVDLLGNTTLSNYAFISDADV